MTENWCKIEVVDGKQVLFTCLYAAEEEKYCVCAMYKDDAMGANVEWKMFFDDEKSAERAFNNGLTQDTARRLIAGEIADILGGSDSHD